MAVEAENRFQIIAGIGEGAFGEVHRARDTQNGNLEVALKRCRLEDEEEGMANATLREIAFLRRLNHENVVELLEVITMGQDVTLVLELMDTDLRHYIQQHRANRNEGLNPDLIKDFLRQLLNGVKFIHRNRILHRDLKPQNLLIGKNCQLKIADFGLAREFGIPVRNFANAVVRIRYPLKF